MTRWGINSLILMVFRRILIPLKFIARKVQELFMRMVGFCGF